MRLFTVDAFADRPFAGNPAAVCLLPHAMPEEWMQKLASEINYSETAYLLAEEGGFGLRWFTPNYEVALCGHATLASAHVLWEIGMLNKSEAARFRTSSGELIANLQGDEIRMDFPKSEVEEVEPPRGLIEAVGGRPVFMGKTEFDYFLEYESEQEIIGLNPDFRALTQFETRGVIVTSRASDYDFVSRFFAPGAGVNEDPATGSAHCALAPYWGVKLNKTRLNAFQASRRGARIGMELMDGRVHLTGRAVTVLRCEISDEAAV
jgi:predicted PhzF superfamily epimerase YddE/YHI9